MGAPLWAGVAVAAGRMAVITRGEDDDDPVASAVVQPVGVGEAFQVVAAIAQTLTDACRATADGPDALAGTGLSVGGHISEDGTTVYFAPGLIAEDGDWTNEPVAPLITAATGKPSVVENDVNCMTEYHRHFGVARGVENFMAVYLAPDVRGLGCGIVASGRLVRGASGGAGELGHLVIQPEGPRCRCGNRGCLEAMLVVHNFNRDLNWGRRDYGMGFEQGAQLVAEGEERARKVFARGGRYLGQGLANVINLLNPELIILGGPPELVDGEPREETSASYFMGAMRQALVDNAFSKMATDCRVVVGRLDIEVAAVGASLLAQARAGENSGEPDPRSDRPRRTNRKKAAS